MKRLTKMLQERERERAAPTEEQIAEFVATLAASDAARPVGPAMSPQQALERIAHN